MSEDAGAPRARRRRPRGLVLLASAGMASFFAGFIFGFAFDDVFLIGALLVVPLGAALAVAVFIFALARGVAEARARHHFAALAMICAGAAFVPACVAGLSAGARGRLEWLIVAHRRALAQGELDPGKPAVLNESGFGGLNNLLLYDPSPDHAETIRLCDFEGVEIRSGYRVCSF